MITSDGCFIFALLLSAATCLPLPAEEPAEKPKPKAEAPLIPLVVMPGQSHQGPLPPLTGAEKILAEALERDVKTLATDIGERNIGRFHDADLLAAETFLEKSLDEAGY